MKNTLSLIGAIAVGIGMIVASAIIVKKYLDKKAEEKKKEEEAEKAELDFLDDDDFNWEDIPVEEDEEDVIAESIKELDDLDSDEK